jgi:hypothetical protein
MPKVTATVLASKIVDGKMLAKIALNGSMPKTGDRLTVKWGRARSNSQNALYWLYLQFLWQDCGLKDEYNTVEELHETLKATFLSNRIFHDGLEFIHVKSTTSLDKLAFGEYLKQIDNAMVEYHHCDTAPFWDAYENNKIPKTEPIKPTSEAPF